MDHFSGMRTSRLCLLAACRRHEACFLRELDELRAHGLIRAIDLRFVMKEPDGTLHALQEQDLPDGSVSSFGALIDPLLGLVAATEIAIVFFRTQLFNSISCRRALRSTGGCTPLIAAHLTNPLPAC